MTPIRRPPLARLAATGATLLIAVLATMGVSSCAGPAASSAPAGAVTAPAAAPATATAVPGASAEAEVQEVFQRYYQALLARDFGTACELTAPETKAALLENVKRQAKITATSCEDAFTKIYATPGAAGVADQIAKTARVTAVRVTGDQASITWTAEVQGREPTVTNGMRRIEGAWRLLDTNA